MNLREAESRGRGRVRDPSVSRLSEDLEEVVLLLREMRDLNVDEVMERIGARQ